MWRFTAWVRVSLQSWLRVGNYMTRWEAQDATEYEERETVILPFGQELNPGKTRAR